MIYFTLNDNVYFFYLQRAIIQEKKKASIVEPS